MAVNWWWQDFYHQLLKCEVRIGKNKTPIGVNLFSVPFFEKLLAPTSDQHLADVSCMFCNRHVVLEHMLIKFLRILKKVVRSFTKKKVIFMTNARQGFSDKQRVWAQVAQKMSSMSKSKNFTTIYLLDVREATVPITSVGKTIFLHFGAAQQKDALSCLTLCNKLDTAILTSRFISKVSEKNVLDFIMPRVWDNEGKFKPTCFNSLLTSNKIKRFFDNDTLQSFAEQLTKAEEGLYSIIVTHTTGAREVLKSKLLQQHFQRREIFCCDGMDRKITKRVKVIMWNTGDIFPMQSYKLFQSLKAQRVFVADPELMGLSSWIVRPLSMLLTCADDSLKHVVVNFLI